MYTPVVAYALGITHPFDKSWNVKWITNIYIIFILQTREINLNYIQITCRNNVNQRINITNSVLTILFNLIFGHNKIPLIMYIIFMKHVSDSFVNSK